MGELDELQGLLKNLSKQKTGRTLTPNQQLEEDRRQEKQAEQEALLNNNARIAYEEEGNKLFSNEEELRALRQEGVFDAVVLKRLSDSYTTLQNTEDVDPLELETAKRSLSLAQGYADSFAERNGLGPRYKDVYLANDELMDNLLDDGNNFTDAIRDVTKNVFQGLVGSVGNVARAQANINPISLATRAGQALSGQEAEPGLLDKAADAVADGAASVNKGIDEVLGESLDIGSLRNQLTTQSLLNRMALPDGAEGKISKTAGALGVLKANLTNADGVLDLGTSIAGIAIGSRGVGAVAKGLTGASITKGVGKVAGKRVGRGTSEAVKNVTASQLAFGLNFDEDTTQAQAQGNLIAGTASGLIPTALGARSAEGAVSAAAARLTRRGGSTGAASKAGAALGAGRSAIAEGIQEGAESVAEGAIAQRPDAANALGPEGVLGTTRTTAELQELKSLAVQGAVLGVAAGAATGGAAEALDLIGGKPTREAVKNREKLFTAQSTAEVELAVDKALKTGDYEAVRAYVDSTKAAGSELYNDPNAKEFVTADELETLAENHLAAKELLAKYDQDNRGPDGKPVDSSEPVRRKRLVEDALKSPTSEIINEIEAFSDPTLDQEGDIQRLTDIVDVLTNPELSPTVEKAMKQRAALAMDNMQKLRDAQAEQQAAAEPAAEPVAEPETETESNDDVPTLTTRVNEDGTTEEIDPPVQQEAPVTEAIAEGDTAAESDLEVDTVLSGVRTLEEAREQGLEPVTLEESVAQVVDPVQDLDAYTELLERSKQAQEDRALASQVSQVIDEGATAQDLGLNPATDTDAVRALGEAVRAEREARATRQTEAQQQPAAQETQSEPEPTPAEPEPTPEAQREDALSTATEAADKALSDVQSAEARAVSSPGPQNDAKLARAQEQLTKSQEALETARADSLETLNEVGKLDDAKTSEFFDQASNSKLFKKLITRAKQLLGKDDPIVQSSPKEPVLKAPRYEGVKDTATNRGMIKRSLQAALSNADYYSLRPDQESRAERIIRDMDGNQSGSTDLARVQHGVRLINKFNSQAGTRMWEAMRQKEKDKRKKPQAPAPGAVETGASESRTLNSQAREELLRVYQPAKVDASIAQESTPEQEQTLETARSFLNDILKNVGVKGIDFMAIVSNPNSGGLFVPIGNKSLIAMSPKNLAALTNPRGNRSKAVQAIQTLRHEAGHHIIREVLGQASPATINALWSDFLSYLDKAAPGIRNAQNRSKFTPTELAGLWLRAGSSDPDTLAIIEGGVDNADFEYSTQFGEYLANRLASALERRDVGNATVNKYFKGMLNMLKKAFDAWNTRIAENPQLFPNASSDQLFDDFLNGITANQNALNPDAPRVNQALRSPREALFLGGNIDFIKVGTPAPETVVFDRSDTHPDDKLYQSNDKGRNVFQNSASDITNVLKGVKASELAGLPVDLNRALNDAKTGDPEAQQLAARKVLDNVGAYSPEITQALDAVLQKMAARIRKADPTAFSDAISDYDVVRFTADPAVISNAGFFRRRADPDEILSTDKQGNPRYYKLDGSSRPANWAGLLKDEAGVVRSIFTPKHSRSLTQTIKDGVLYTDVKRKFASSVALTRSHQDIFERTLRLNRGADKKITEEIKDAVDLDETLEKFLESEPNDFQILDTLSVHSELTTQDGRAREGMNTLRFTTAGGKKTATLRELQAQQVSLEKNIQVNRGDINSNTSNTQTNDRLLVSAAALEANGTLWAEQGAKPKTKKSLAKDPAALKKLEKFLALKDKFSRAQITAKQKDSFLRMALDPDIIANPTDRPTYAPLGLTDAEARQVMEIALPTNKAKEAFEAYSNNIQAQLRHMEKLRKAMGAETGNDRFTRAKYGFKKFVPVFGTDSVENTAFDQYFREADFEGKLTDDKKKGLAQTEANQDPFRRSVSSTINQRAQQLHFELAAQDTVRSLMMNNLAAKYSTTFRNGYTQGEQSALRQGGLYKEANLPGAELRTLETNSVEFKALQKDSPPGLVTYYHGDDTASVMILNDDGAKNIKGEELVGDEARREADTAAARLYRGAGYTTRFMSKMQTWYNIPFALYSAYREINNVAKLVSLEDDQGAVGQFKTLAQGYKNLFAASGSIAKYVHYKSQNTTAGNAKLQALISNSPNANLLRMALEYEQNGGVTTLPRSFGRQARDSGLGKSIAKTLPKGVRSTLSSADKVLDNINATSEMVARLTYYQNQRQRGVSPRRAASRTKDLTNFEASGIFGGPMGHLFMFSRVAASGNFEALDRFLEANRSTQIQAMAVSAGMGYIQMLAALSLAEEDEEGRNPIAELSGKLWQRNAVFQIGGEFVRVPYGFGTLASAQAAGAQFARLMHTDQTLNETSKNIRDVTLDPFKFLPATGVGPSSLRQMKSFIPSPVRPIFDIIDNLNGMGTPVRNRYAPESFSPDASLGGRDNTISNAYDTLARGIAETTGIEVNPDDLKYFANSYFGAISYIYEASFELYANAFPGDEEYIFNKKKGLWPMTAFYSPQFSRQAEVFYGECSNKFTGSGADDACKKTKNKLSSIGRKYQDAIRARDGKGKTQRLQREQAKQMQEVYREFNISRGLTSED